MALKKAQKKKVKLKIGFSGPSGFGKTYSALLMAYGVTGDWSKIAVIDSENESASLYSDLGEYNVFNLNPPYTPESYMSAINECVAAGMEVAIIDSITHEWNGAGGCLEIADAIAQASASKNSYIAWGKVTPRHRKFIDTILQSPIHIFTTVRRKQDYEMSKDSSGRTKIQKVGTKEETRDGFEYELTTNFEFQSDKHYVTASKDRTGIYADSDPFIITIDTGKKLKEWANNGVDESKYAIESINAVKSRSELSQVYKLYKHLMSEVEVCKAFEEMGKKYPEEKTK